MTVAEWIAVTVLALIVALMVIGAVKLKRKQTEWAWLHPPNDDDGVSILEEDDPDGQNTR